MEEQALSVEPLSFVRFVYPFNFNESSFKDRVTAIDGAEWKSADQELRVWSPAHFPESDLLPHVANYLGTRTPAAETARLWTIQESALVSRGGLGGGSSQHKTRWFLETPHSTLPFYIESIQLCLFRVGIGFLTFCIYPGFSDLASWYDFIHYFRYYRERRGLYIRAEIKEPKEVVREFFPNPTRTSPKKPDEKHHFVEIVQLMLSTGGMTSEEEDWWRDIFAPGQLLPYVCLFVKGRDDREQLSLLAYRLRNFFHSRQEIHPSLDDLREDSPGILSWGDKQWFLFSIEGGSFFACNMSSTPFFRETLPNHLRNIYFLVFLLALHQKFTMNMLSHRVAHHWIAAQASSEDEGRYHAFTSIRDTLFAFSARGYFTQIFQLEHHHRYYKRWQEVLQTARLFSELKDEVKEMFDYLMLQRQDRIQRIVEDQEKRAQRLEKLVSLGAGMVGLPILGLTFQLAALGSDFLLAALITVGTLCLGLGGYFGARKLIKRDDHK